MSRLVLSDRPFDSIKPRVGDMRPQPLPWGKGALPARLASGPVTCSAAGAVRWNRLLSSPETWQGEREDAQREQRGQGSRRVIAREPLPTCSRGLRTNTATTAILTVSSSRCQMPEFSYVQSFMALRRNLDLRDSCHMCLSVASLSPVALYLSPSDFLDDSYLTFHIHMTSRKEFWGSLWFRSFSYFQKPEGSKTLLTF